MERPFPSFRNRLANRRKVVLVLSTADTCRSAMAAGYLRKLLQDRRILHVDIRPAGVLTVPGLLASQEAISIMHSEGIDISKHRSSPLTPDMIRRADLVLGMTPLHIQEAVKLSKDARGKSYLLKEYVNCDPKNAQIPDPMGSTLEIFKKCFKEIREACAMFADTDFVAGRRNRGPLDLEAGRVVRPNRKFEPDADYEALYAHLSDEDEEEDLEELEAAKAKAKAKPPAPVAPKPAGAPVRSGFGQPFGSKVMARTAPMSAGALALVSIPVRPQGIVVKEVAVASATVKPEAVKVTSKPAPSILPVKPAAAPAGKLHGTAGAPAKKNSGATSKPVAANKAAANKAAARPSGSAKSETAKSASVKSASVKSAARSVAVSGSRGKVVKGRSGAGAAPVKVAGKSVPVRNATGVKASSKSVARPASKALDKAPKGKSTPAAAPRNSAKGRSASGTSVSGKAGRSAISKPAPRRVSGASPSKASSSKLSSKISAGKSTVHAKSTAKGVKARIESVVRGAKVKGRASTTAGKALGNGGRSASKPVAKAGSKLVAKGGSKLVGKAGSRGAAKAGSKQIVKIGSKAATSAKTAPTKRGATKPATRSTASARKTKVLPPVKPSRPGTRAVAKGSAGPMPARKAMLRGAVGAARKGK